MTILESNKKDLNISAKQVFDFVADCNNFIKLLPEEKIENWSSTTDDCSFRIKGIASLALKINEKRESAFICMVDNGDAPFKLSMNFYIAETSANSCTTQVTFEAELNPMLKMMVSTPLTNLLNIINDRLERIDS